MEPFLLALGSSESIEPFREEWAFCLGTEYIGIRFLEFGGLSEDLKTWQQPQGLRGGVEHSAERPTSFPRGGL